MAADRADALVIFGATGDLAKLETFPALVGLVERGVLGVPVIGVANSGWGLDQFRTYAVESLKLNDIDPASQAATKMLGLLRYVDGDLGDPATYMGMAAAMGAVGRSAHPHPGWQVPAGDGDRGVLPVPQATARRVRRWPPVQREPAAGAYLPRRPGERDGCGQETSLDMAPQLRELAYSGQVAEQMMRPYDRLIGAALAGDRYLFAREDTVEAAWRVVQPVLGDIVPVEHYARGSWGPAHADALVPGGEAWHNPVG